MKVNLLTLPSRCPLCVTPAAHDETEMAVNGNGDLGMSQMAVIYFGRSRRSSPTWRIAVEAVTESERRRGRQSLFHRAARTHSFSCSADRAVCLRVENIHDEMIINIAEDGDALGVVLAFSASQNSSLVKNLKVEGMRTSFR